MMTLDQYTPSTLGRERPLGVWLFTIFYTAIACGGIFGWSRILLVGLPHGMGNEALLIAPWFLALFCGLLCLVWGAWYGSRVARASFLVVLTLLVFMGLQGVPSRILTAIGEGTEPDARRSALIYSLTQSLLYLGCLAITYWYFLGGATRRFYGR